MSILGMSVRSGLTHLGWADDLFTGDVRMAAVLGQFTQHLEVDPTQRQWAASVAPDEVVEGQFRRDLAGLRAGVLVGPLDGLDRVGVVDVERLVWRVWYADLSAGARPVIASPNHPLAPNMACLTRPSSVDLTGDRRACPSVSPFKR